MRHEVNPDPLRVRRGEGGTTPADAKPGATANGQGRRGSGLLPMRMHQDYHQDYTRITPGLLLHVALSWRQVLVLYEITLATRLSVP